MAPSEILKSFPSGGFLRCFSVVHLFSPDKGTRLELINVITVFTNVGVTTLLLNHCHQCELGPNAVPSR